MSIDSRDKTANSEELNKLDKPETDIRDSGEDDSMQSIDKSKRRLTKLSAKAFRPIILSFLLTIMVFPGLLRAQLTGSVSLGTRYSDNVFALSDYDFERLDQEHPDLDFVETSDDLSLLANVDLGYKLNYKWWRFIPSVSATISENIQNKEKYRRDALLRFRVERYYWNFTVLYGYSPHTYVRNYTDSDGTGDSEQFVYAKDLFRGDLNIRPFTNTSVRLHGRHEIYRYNEFFTEFDSDATTWGGSIRHNFPYFGMEAGYYYKVLDNSNNIVDPLEDASYENNEYEVVLLMKKMLLDNNKPRGATWQPSVELSYQERFFQGTDDWYGGRVDKIYGLRGTLSFDLTKAMNLNLDYSHVNRNIDSPSATVRRLKEYSENRLSASLSYKF